LRNHQFSIGYWIEKLRPRNDELSSVANAHAGAPLRGAGPQPPRGERLTNQE
jgi:hypothetical protein